MADTDTYRESFDTLRRNNFLKKFFKLHNLIIFVGAERFVEMTIPLTFGHLIRVTCMRAGHRESMEQKECWRR